MGRRAGSLARFGGTVPKRRQLLLRFKDATFLVVRGSFLDGGTYHWQEERFLGYTLSRPDYTGMTTVGRRP